MTTAKKTPAKKETVKKTAVKAAAKTVKAAKPAAKKAAVKAPKTTAKVAVKKAADKKSTEKKPAVKKAAVKKVAYTESVSNAAKILFELRAQKLQLIDLRGISETADFMIIATCESEAQMQAILTELSKTFKHQGLPHRTEYKPGINMRWAVFDAGFDLMVQLFEESKRKELAFDKLYSDAKVTDLDEKNFVKKATKKAKADDELI
ncbi:MAG: ribosome silencing factor [Hallerella porci]|uniref:Ribosome silencing factor RsfS/YbeB/iojap n=1 Tax=Hallerella porci TaxID=1945871 RepID=A0ABX5LP58_9BACT|nr:MULTISPECIES: ribosome silencing factor [Hallerella]MCI5600144.1 ribosome silencing factor [Hallerella sp.]MDY3922543.1 ribosome silencing factor [Hallerella porci]PWL01892.1 ribosome silencing factor RsfS/YbeB/iojap [Hallerella porci]